MGALKQQKDPAPIRACTVSRDVQQFEFLIDDMETALGEAWGDLSFDDMLVFLDQPEAQALEFLVVAVGLEDANDQDLIARVISEASARGLGVILVSADLEPNALHALMRAGAREFLPYPVPERALEDAIQKLSTPVAAPVAPAAPPREAASDSSDDCVLIAVHPMAGGVGATTFATNLAYELAIQKNAPPKVALLDLDFQFGEVATYLDLPRRDAIYELLSDLESADDDSLAQALLDYKGQMAVLTAPAEMLPLDIVSPEDMEKLCRMARAQFDIVVIDMPRTLVGWTDTVLNLSDIYMPVVELDMRSAQNTLRFLKALAAEDLDLDKLRFVLNRAPKFTDLTGRGRLKRMAESLDIKLGDQLPDGTAAVTEASDQGLPLAESARKNPMRREIARIAKELNDTRAKAAASAK